jgi:hypothetical protein
MRWSILVRGCCLTLRVRLPVLCGACVRLLPLSFGQPHAEPSRVRFEQLPELSCWAARAGAFGAQMPPTITAAARWLSSGRSFVCAFVCACLSSSSLPAAVFNTGQQEECKRLSSLPALSSAVFSFADPRTLYDFSAVLQIIEGKDAWQRQTREGRHAEARWTVELGSTSAELADGSTKERLRAVRFAVAAAGPG